MNYPSASRTLETSGFGEQPLQDIASIDNASKVKVRRCVRVKRSRPIQVSEPWGARVLMRITDESGPVTKAQVGCFVVAAWRYSRMARAHSVSEHRRPVDNEVGLRCVRASVAVLRKSSSVWHDVAVSHRRAHRQRCTQKANQRRAADGCPTCADDDKLGNDDDVMTCDITPIGSRARKRLLCNAFVVSGLWDSTPTGEVSRPRPPREQHT